MKERSVAERRRGSSIIRLRPQGLISPLRLRFAQPPLPTEEAFRPPIITKIGRENKFSADFCKHTYKKPHKRIVLLFLFEELIVSARDHAVIELTELICTLTVEALEALVGG